VRQRCGTALKRAGLSIGGLSIISKIVFNKKTVKKRKHCFKQMKEKIYTFECLMVYINMLGVKVRNIFTLSDFKFHKVKPALLS